MKEEMILLDWLRKEYDYAYKEYLAAPSMEAKHYTGGYTNALRDVIAEVEGCTGDVRKGRVEMSFYVFNRLSARSLQLRKLKRKRLIDKCHAKATNWALRAYGSTLDGMTVSRCVQRAKRWRDLGKKLSEIKD